jgi:phosphocarrier protein HPr
MNDGAAQPSPAERGQVGPSQPIEPSQMDAGEPLPTVAPVLSRIVSICNKRGLHARAAARFVTMAERFGASVDVLRDGQTVSARSIMGLMMLGAGRGAEIELRAEGWDAKEALDALAALVEAGFDEQD